MKHKKAKEKKNEKDLVDYYKRFRAPVRRGVYFVQRQFG
jgi:hypothetical protein